MPVRLSNRFSSALFPLIVLSVYSNFFGFKHLQDEVRLLQLVFLSIAILIVWFGRGYALKFALQHSLLFPLILFLTFINAKLAFGANFADWAVTNSYYLLFYIVIYFNTLDFRRLNPVLNYYYWIYSALSYLICIGPFRDIFLFVPENLSAAECFIPGIQLFVAITVFRIIHSRGMVHTAYVINTMAVVFLTGNRATIFSFLLLYIIFISWRVSFKRSLVIFLAAAFGLIAAQSALGLETIENLADSEYPRTRSAIYFATEYYRTAIDWLFGYGLGHPSNALGELQMSLRERGIYHSDLGVLGTLFQVGIIGSIFLYGQLLVGPRSRYKTLILIYVISGFTMHQLLSGVSFVFLAIVVQLNRIQNESISIS